MVTNLNVRVLLHAAVLMFLSLHVLDALKITRNLSSVVCVTVCVRSVLLKWAPLHLKRSVRIIFRYIL